MTGRCQPVDACAAAGGGHGAVASFAFRQRHAVLDTNVAVLAGVRRVEYRTGGPSAAERGLARHCCRPSDRCARGQSPMSSAR
jgi:hypothetical protein